MNTSSSHFLNVGHCLTAIGTSYKPLIENDWQQKWRKLEPTTMVDQYGFQISKDESKAKPYTLLWKGAMVCNVHRLGTAKLISIIILNDILMFHQTPYPKHEFNK